LKTVLVVLFFILFFGSALCAEAMSGSSLLLECQEFTGQASFRDNPSANTCHSYVLGGHDMIQHFETRNQTKSYCGPQKPDTYQLALIVKKYLQDNSTSLHHSAASLVVSALSEAYPCISTPENVITPGNLYRDHRGYR
jgi:hypothetical protein